MRKPSLEEMRKQFNYKAWQEESAFYWGDVYDKRIWGPRILDDKIAIDTRDQYYLSENLIGIGP